MEHLLEVNELRTSFFSPGGEVKAVNNVSFYVDPGEVVAVVGESGCGKSVTQMSVMRLVQSPPGVILGGQVLFEGQDLLQLRQKQMRRIRGSWLPWVYSSQHISPVSQNYAECHSIKGKVGQKAQPQAHPRQRAVTEVIEGP